MRKFASSTLGRVVLASACTIGLIAATAPMASGAGGLNADQGVVSTDAGVAAKAKSYYAVVDADGTLARGRGAVSATNLGAGAYIVTFSKNVRACSYTATVGLSGASGVSAPGFITTVGAAASEMGVFLTTHDTTGASSNLGFHLQVEC